MASSVHPFKGCQDNGANNHPPPGYGNPAPSSYGGYAAGYGGANGAGANTGAGYPPYGAPRPIAGYAYGAPQPNGGYAYGAPGNSGYTMGTSGIRYSLDALGNIDVPMSALGHPTYGYGGAPNAAGYIGGGVPAGYPVHAPPPGTVGYPFGGVAPGDAYPVACYPAAADAAGGGGGGGGGSEAPGGYMGFADGQSPSQQQPVDPRNQIQSGRWAAGLCACCDDCATNLLMAWCCPCVSLAQIYARTGLMQYKPAIACFFLLCMVGLVGNFIPHMRSSRSSSSSSSGGLYCSNDQYHSTGSSMATLILAMMIMVGQTIFRAHIWDACSKVRQRFQIPDGVCSDCCASCCCSCCAIAQLATHVKSYTPGSCSFDSPDVLPAYTH